MTSMTMRLALICLLFFGAGIVHAEGGCPQGYYPIGAPQGQQGPQGCAPIPGYNQNQNQVPPPQPPQWASRWGAVATDAANGILGTATNLTSKSEAEQMAFADCQSKGGSNCKLQISYDNECAAMVVGDKVFDVTADATVEKAIQAGMKSCSVANDHTCHVYYSACSLPERIK